MTEEFKLERIKPACSECTREFQAEDVLVSCIFAVGEEFQRKDFCRDCFSHRKEEPFSYWDTRFPRREKPKLQDIEKVQKFFTQLLAKNLQGPNIDKIKFFAALVLVRKKRLKLLGTAVKDKTYLRLEKTWDGETLEIADPGINEAELEAVRTEMEQLFDAELSAG